MTRQLFWLLLVMFLYLPSVLAQSHGMVALGTGTATNDDVAEQKATSSLFLVEVWESLNLSLGAMVNDISQTSTLRFSEASRSDTTYYNLVQSDQNQAWGTLLAWSWYNEGFFGLQVWGGVGYVSNRMTSRLDSTFLIAESDGGVIQCGFSQEGVTTEVKSTPLFMGLGFTINDFGFFLQTMQQDINPQVVDFTGQADCTYLTGGSSYNFSLKNKQTYKVNPSFSQTVVGVQYRF